MADAQVVATALLLKFINEPDSADSYAKGEESAKLRMARSLLRDAAEVAESELRSRGIEVQHMEFSADE